MARLPDPALWDAFTDGHQFVLEGEERGPLVMRTEEVGVLVLPSGRVVTCDPLLDPWRPPFSFRARPGRYPVFAAVTRDDNALILVRFRSRAPVRWETARPDCFGVDSATGCLMDYRVARFLLRRARANKYDRYWRLFNDHKEGRLRSDSVCQDESSGANVILFHTFGGDGTFPFYGYDARDRLVCLVTDMLLDHTVFDGWEE